MVTYVEKDNVNQTISYDSLACKNSFSTARCELTNQRGPGGAFKETGAKTAAAMGDMRKLMCLLSIIACKHILVVTQNKIVILKMSICLIQIQVSCGTK